MARKAKDTATRICGRPLKTLAAAIAFTSLIASSACSSPQAPAPSPAPSKAEMSSGESIASPPSPSVTVSAIRKSAAGNYSVEQLKAMSVDQYNKLPQSDRLPLVKHQLEEAQKVILIDYGNDDLYKNDPLEAASLNNTPDQIMKQILFEMQIAGMQGKTNNIEDGTPDKIAAKKALSAAFYYVDPSKNNVAFEYTKMVSTIENSPSIFKNSDKLTNVRDLYPVKSVTNAEGKKIDVRTITTVADDGKPHTFEVTYTMLDETKGIWQIYNSL